MSPFSLAPYLGKHDFPCNGGTIFTAEMIAYSYKNNLPQTSRFKHIHLTSFINPVTGSSSIFPNFCNVVFLSDSRHEPEF